MHLLYFILLYYPCTYPLLRLIPLLRYCCLKDSLFPLLVLRSKLDGGKTPVLAVVCTKSQSCPNVTGQRCATYCVPCPHRYRRRP